MDIPIELCTSAKAYKSAPAKRYFLLAVIVCTYCVVLPFCYYTAGEPRKAATIHAQQLADEKWALESLNMGNETALLDSEDAPLSLPPPYLPSALACVALFLTVTFHALFHLLCRWVVGFKALTLFSRATKVDENDCFILVTPPPNRGKGDLVPLKRSTVAGSLQMEFQRQTYVYHSSEELGDDDEAGKKYPNGVFTLSGCPVDLPLGEYLASRGLVSEAEIERVTDRWGKNHLAVHVPGFLELLQVQLLSPLAMFQVFCALLWLLDEYWTYTLWTLASVVIFEATTVFQRTRTQTMLGGMAPKPTPIYVHRCNSWQLVTTKDLLPGDVISLAFKRRGNNNNNNSPAANPSAPTGTAAGPTTVAAGAAPGADNDDDSNTNHIPITARDEVVPCDCLLLTGSAVVNEASLTGESVPQMKESISSEESSTALDMNGLHRVHTLFSGTSIVTITGVDTDINTNSNNTDSSNNKNNKKNKSSSSAGSTHAAASTSSVPTPPDSGAIAYVLKTGFSSSQGKLLQMIEFSQQAVTGDSKETGKALLMLFVFALIAAGYVLKEGLRKKEKTTHEILLKCVIIITSVVPRQFPMQMAMAVNMALMALSKAGIFCTEQYRVPLAGKITHCLFDKTGTLTTDQLVPVGIINPGELSSKTDKSLPSLTPVVTASSETAMILAACHSLVVVDDSASNPGTGTLVGDPIELAAIQGVNWSWDAVTSTASPGSWQREVKALEIVRRKLAEHRRQLEQLASQQPQAANNGNNNVVPQTPQMKAVQTAIDTLVADAVLLEGKISDAKRKASLAPYSGVTVEVRHHFSSQLQRMSVVCSCTPNNATSTSSSNANKDWFCLVKGSPEAIKTLLLPSAIPPLYSQTYEMLARRGLRVLALAYKQVSSNNNPKDQSRTSVESDLKFGGFIAFECKIRGDSRIVMKALLEADHKVTMLTGDALLTSLHVARQVDICDRKGKATLTLVGIEPPTSASSSSKPFAPHWQRRKEEIADDESHSDSTAVVVEDIVPFSIDSVPQLAETHDMLTTEPDFMAVIEATGGKDSKFWKMVEFFKVFARMSPPGKASIIRAIQEANPNTNHVLMCGDGGNDVGALKQADVGLALLAGHANANTTEEISTEDEKNSEKSIVKSDKPTEAVGKSAEDSLNAHENQLKRRGAEFNAKRAAHMKEFQARYTKEQQALVQEEIKVLTEKGEFMAMFSVMKNQAARVKKGLEDENRRYMALHGHIWDPKKDGDGLGGEGGASGGLSSLLANMDTADAGGLPVVRPGDASVAAPFTSRTPSVRSVVDLIRQGRCTLLSALMQQQIMMLESIIAAYTLSALSLHNARSSERQMMASSWLIMTAAVSFSYASPLDHMHPLRPLRSLFHPAILLSILGQAVIHIACMTLAVQWATEAMGPELLKEVAEFFRKAKAKELENQCGEDDYMCQMNAFWAAPFMPNLLNSVVFLVETSQMISVFFANYKGRPWMKGMLENHPLFLSVFLCIGGVVVASWEMVPQLNELIQLAPFPDDTFRYKVVLLVIATIAGTFLWDRFCVYMFAPKVFKVITDEAKKTTYKDLIPILMTAGKVVAGVLLLSTGNILLIGGAAWWYRSYYLKQQAALGK